MTNGESWLIDPETRDYVQVKGNPVVDRSLKMPIYFRTLVPRTRWLYAPDTKYGSDFWAYKDRQTPNAAGTAQAIERRAVAPLLDDGRAIDIQVTTINDPRNGVQLTVTALDASGQQTSELTLAPIRL